MIKQKLFILLSVIALSLAAQASDYVLYSPDPNKGGEVGPDGTWQVTDECAASQSFLDQDR